MGHKSATLLIVGHARMVCFFQRLAPTNGPTFETPAAMKAGFDVFDELISDAKQRAGAQRKTHPVP